MEKITELRVNPETEPILEELTCDDVKVLLETTPSLLTWLEGSQLPFLMMLDTMAFTDCLK